MVGMNEIQVYVDRIAKEFHPDKIVLFGSYAYGTPSIDSDIDLLVVLPFEGKNWRMASEIRIRTRPDFPLDLLVRSPEQLARRLNAKDAFISEIFQQGKILYETRNR